MDEGNAYKPSKDSEHGIVRELRPCDGKSGENYLDSRLPRPRRQRFIQSLAFVLALIMVAGAGLGVFSSVKKNPDGEKVMLAVPLFMTHSPILIESEAALTVANGVTVGDGSAGNPFVIQGWDIDASSAMAAGIAVSNITSHLVIRNVNVHSGGSSNLGIALINNTNCTVEHSLSSHNYAGIGALMCDHIVIQNNTVENNELEGILIFDTDYARVAHNIVVNSSVGIALFDTIESSVVDNAVTFNNNAGLALQASTLATISGNIMDNNSIGLLMTQSEGSQIDKNMVVRNWNIGVYLMFSQNNTLFSNTVSDTWGGYGATLMFSTNNTFYRNNFLDNFLSPQATDDSDQNNWNLGYPIGGNYWSDYTGSDAFGGPNQNTGGPDGIGDTPYDIDSLLTVRDNYPLMMEVAYDNTPSAFFTVTPASGTVSTIFTFDASLSWDPDNLTSELRVRWDFNGDGSWDTGWSTDKIVQHSYTLGGEYNVTMEVMSAATRTGNMTWYVEVDDAVIPEFTTILVPICSMIAIFLVIVPLGKRR
jgi:parallel beta-helix repeat protein